MAQIFTTETSTMNVTAGRVDGVNGEIGTELTTLRGTVDGLAGLWVGSAKTKFDQLMIDWDDAAKRLSEALNTISETIRANSADFDSGEDDNVTELNNASSNLNL
ncbi:WXG100 family type VII secretion target [Corynebacterium ulceribovis]|uniref:WXG100 family type VII secretion target n=1 Tax=Corynebacterium ulceribovis TaxID=487732 RepID=UPI0003729A22|nr:WXG100 family type VII secretion target [Corynebacterium ulceribovis]